MRHKPLTTTCTSLEGYAASACKGAHILSRGNALDGIDSQSSPHGTAHYVVPGELAARPCDDTTRRPCLVRRH